MASILFLLMTCMSAAAMDKKAETADTPAVVAADLGEITATVQAVDYNNQTITLKGPNGNVATVDVHSRVKNLDKVKVGDKVRIKFYKSVVVYVARTDRKPEAIGAVKMGVAPHGDMPGIESVDVMEVIAKVDSVDHKKGTITLTGPRGNRHTLKVDKKAKYFNDIKKGDDVVVRATEAVVMDISKK